MLELCRCESSTAGKTQVGTTPRTRMSCRMTLIDSVAPCGVFSRGPFGKVEQQAGFQAAPTRRLEWIHTKYIQPVLSRLESVSGLVSISPHQHNQLLLPRFDYNIQEIWCSSHRHKYLLRSPQPSVRTPSLPVCAAHVMVSCCRLTQPQSFHVPRLCSSAAM